MEIWAAHITLGMEAKTKKILAIAAIPVLIGGWAAFRPELLFVNQKVNEAAPTAAMSMVLSKGDFNSYAHETKGTAQILKSSGKNVLRFTNFTTSNGPDVHVYLVKGADPKDVKDGSYLDLGSLKGNQGDQNYDLPADADQYGSVNIWCKRFSVGFGGATLAKQTSYLSPVERNGNLVLASYLGGDIKVTGGDFHADASGVKGHADLIERTGKRFLKLSGVKLPKGVNAEIYIIKKETTPKGADISSFTKIKLGSTTGGNSLLPVSKDIDAWLYRTITLWNPVTKKPLGSAFLRSDQEKKALIETTEQIA